MNVLLLFYHCKISLGFPLLLAFKLYTIVVHYDRRGSALGGSMLKGSAELIIDFGWHLVDQWSTRASLLIYPPSIYLFGFFYAQALK